MRNISAISTIIIIRTVIITKLLHNLRLKNVFTIIQDQNIEQKHQTKL